MIGILLVTFCLTVFADLVVAVNVGVMLASLMFMQRMARAVQIQEDGEALRAAAETEELDLPPGTVVFNIEGPFFFAAAEKLERVLTNDPGTGVMRHVDAGYEHAREVARERGLNVPML